MNKPKKQHCLLIFFKDSSTDQSGSYLEPIKEILIEDEVTLSEIIKIGYTRSDMQSLFESKYYSYLTVDSIELVAQGYTNDKKKIEKDIIALKFVKKYLNTKNESIPENCYCFDFSFPKHMIENINKEINFTKELNLYAKIGAIRSLNRLLLISSSTVETVTNNISKRLPLSNNLLEEDLFLLENLKAKFYSDDKSYGVDIFFNDELHSEWERFLIDDPFDKKTALHVSYIYADFFNELSLLKLPKT